MDRQLTIFLILILGVWSAQGQVSSITIDHWIDTWPYSNPAKSDSILYWADKIEGESERIAYQRGINYANRFRAYYYHFEGDVPKATELYLVFLKNSKSISHLEDEISAISDLVYTYISLGQNNKAKTLLTETINYAHSAKIGPKQLSSFYNNLGIVYSRNENIDSAAWAYNESLEIKERIGDEKGLMDLRVNLSSLYIKLGKYKEAIQLSEDNLKYLEEENDKSGIIYNLINRAAGLFEIGKLTEAEENAIKAVNLAEDIGDVTLQQLSTSSLSSLYQKSGQYEKAYENLLKSERIKSNMLNEQSNIRIAELREHYEADKRDQDNKLLSVEVAEQKSRIKFYSIGIVGLLLLLGTLTWFWKSNRSKNILLEKQNEQIQKQNEKLTALNTTKNNLMSMVSHDLSTPFSTIKIWMQGLGADSHGSDIEETREAIIRLSDEALKSIDGVLTIDNEEVSSVKLSEIIIRDFLSDVVSRHMQIALKKGVHINSETTPDNLKILSDVSMLSRVLDNLTSNAIKYANATISLSAVHEDDTVILKVEDDGIGISAEDQKTLFDSYATGSIKPSQGEPSHGLGLAIVQRLVDELGGLVRVQSELKKGSVFTIRLPL